MKKKKRIDTFSFQRLGIPAGAILSFKRDPRITVTVIDDRHVDFLGRVMYPSGVVKNLLGYTTDPLRFLVYSGRTISRIRTERKILANMKRNERYTSQYSGESQ